MKYKHLYAAGCSFTKHQPLPEDDLWPTMLSKKLNIPSVINQGQGGAGNDSIFKTVNNFILRTHTPPDEILAVIQFTFPFRFTLPSGATGSGWKHYLNNYSGFDENNDHPDEVINLEYYYARERMYAWHPAHSIWEFYMQISAISNLLYKANINHYCVCIDSPPKWPKSIEPVGGDKFGNPTGTIEFDQSNINWLWEDVWQSNLYYQVEEQDLKNTTISDTDIHFNSKTHDHLSDAMVNRIKYLEEKA